MTGQIPVALAFGSGLVAAVNPCGFAMLPAFASYYVGAVTPQTSGRTRVTDGLFVGAVLTAGFMLVFGLSGAVLSLGARAAIRYVPWLAILVGASLIVLGGWMLAGRSVVVRARWSRPVPVDGRRSMFAFGIAYAIGSMSCALPVFLAVIAGGLAAGSAPGTLAVFAAYALGMATVLMLISVATASFREVLVRRIRTVLPYVGRISGGLLVSGGAYVTYYWASVLAGTRQRGPAVWVGTAQRWVQDLVLGIGPDVWLVIASTLVGATLVVALSRWRARVRVSPDAPALDAQEAEILPSGCER